MVRSCSGKRRKTPVLWKFVVDSINVTSVVRLFLWIWFSGFLIVILK